MAELAPKTHWTVEEYLAFERAAEGRHEFYHGDILAMAGGTEKHASIVSNIHGQLYAALRGSACKPYTSEMRIRGANSDFWTYPDISVVCGKPQFVNEPPDTLVNPTVIFEVLSPSTEKYDRQDKFDEYTNIVSLRSVIFVSQDSPRVEMFFREPGAGWGYLAVNDLQGSIEIPAMKHSMLLADIYEGIQFEPPQIVRAIPFK